MPKLNKKLSEPSILVKPISRFGGLDNIHVALLILVVILILLVVAISFNTKITIVNQTQGVTCTYGSFNGTCLMPIHTQAQAKLAAEKILAGYAASNSSISLLPYLSNVSAANVSYVPATKQWYASIPYTSPVNTKVYILNIAMQDSNLTKFSTFVQTIGNNPSTTNNYVATKGVIKLYQQTTCGAGPVQVYWFMDPYTPGAVQSLLNATSLETKYSNKVNVTVKILYTQYSQSLANTYGLNNTLNLGRYILCGSIQKNFTGFVKALNASYTNSYMPQYVLSGIAGASGFNMSSLNSCIASSQQAMNAEAVQAKYYNITSSLAVLTDCQYLSLPQTAKAAICYANSTLC